MRSSSHSTSLAKSLAFALLPFAAGGVSAQPVPATLPPVEQCSGDATFSAFREKLKSAVAKKDREAFLAMLAPDVLVDFGGGTGRDAFAKQWNFDTAEHGNVWDQLETMLKMGCAVEEGAKVIPSLIIQLNTEDDEEFVDRVVILPGAKLYRETGVESADPSTVPWTLAPVTSRAGDLVTGVQLPDGRQGFIPDDQVYEPTGYRMVIEQDDAGKWMITAFVAGD